MWRWLVALFVGSASACALLVDTNDLGGGRDLPDGGGDATTTIDAPSGADAASDAPADAPAEAAPPETAYAAAVLADGPIAYYRLEETTGITAKTEVGSVNGVYTGELTQGAPGAFDGSVGVAFDGGSGGVSLGLSFDFVDTQPFSLEAWYLPTAYATDYRFILSKDSEDDAGRETYGIFFNGNYGTMQFERYVAGAKTGPGGSNPAKGAWHHIVVTYDGAVSSLYIDGGLLDSTPDTRSARAKPVPFWIGRQSSDFYALNGVVDEVAIYDKALSAARVMAHVAAAKP